MNIAEIIKLENERTTPDMYGHIHFIKEGNFYRAHDGLQETMEGDTQR